MQPPPRRRRLEPSICKITRFSQSIAMGGTAAVPNEQVTKLEWFSGVCACHSKIETNHKKTYTPRGPKWKYALALIQKIEKSLQEINRLIQMGGVMWSTGQDPILAFCGLEEKGCCCNTVKCPLPFAIPGSTGFQYRVQAQAIAATLTDSCNSNSKCLNQCKTRLQTGLVDPVAQARARAIAGARR